MNNVTEFLPFLVPLVISELALLAYTLYHILTHKSYKRGNRTLWLIVVIVGMQFIGPILYFLLGKEDSWANNLKCLKCLNLLQNIKY